MLHLKLSIVLFVVFLLSTSCSFVNKLKEKFSSVEEKLEEVGDKSKTTSSPDTEFYNKYMEAYNKLQEAGDNLYKSYITDVPDAKSVTKNSFITGTFMKNSVDRMEMEIKNYKRSLYEGGESSKLSAENKEMQKEVEENFKTLLKVLEEFHEIAKPVADYYSGGKFKDDLSKVETYDTQMKQGNDKYREAFKKFSDSLKKFKPQRKKRDIESIKNPDHKAVAILLESYESTLENMEPFTEKFESYQYDNKNQDEILTIINEIENNFNKNKQTVLSTEFSDRTKIFKYNFEDGFTKSVETFIKETRDFLRDHRDGKISKNNFGYKHGNVINYYNTFISIYNSHINALNSYIKQ